MRGRYRILLGAAAGRRQDLPHAAGGPAGAGRGRRRRDRLPRAARPARDGGARRRPRDRAAARGRARRLELEEMDVDAVIRRAPELALVDELAHTNAPGSRNEKRYEDIDEILDAGIDVISTVNVQHLESLNDAVYELTGVRVRETFPDRILDDADEVVLVDLSPEALQRGSGRARSTRPSGSRRRSQNFFRVENLSALRELALREVAEDVGARRRPTCSTRSASRRSPSASSRSSRRSRARSASCAAPGARRSGSEPRSTRSGCGRPGKEPSEEEKVQLAALRRLAIVLGAHFLEEEGDDLVDDRAPRRRRPRLDLRLRSARPTSAAGARSSAARSSRAWSASCPASTSASSPTGARRQELEAMRLGRHASATRPGRPRLLVPFAGGSTRRARRRDPDRTRRGGGARARLPADRPAASARRSRLRPRSPSRCRCSRRSSTRRSRGRAGRRTDRERQDADPRAAAALGGRALRPDRRPGRRPAPASRAKDLAWMLTDAPSETLVLKPAPVAQPT